LFTPSNVTRRKQNLLSGYFALFNAVHCKEEQRYRNICSGFLAKDSMPLKMKYIQYGNGEILILRLPRLSTKVQKTNPSLTDRKNILTGC